MRQLSNFGINLDPAARVPLGALASCGTNAKMSEYHAAIGLASLSKWERNAQDRRALRNDLMHALDREAGQRLRWQRAGAGGDVVAPTLLCARLPNAELRDALERACQQAHIATRRWYLPLLQHMPALAPLCDVLHTPVAHGLAQTLLGLPFFPQMSPEQRERVLTPVRMLFEGQQLDVAGAVKPPLVLP